MKNIKFITKSDFRSFVVACGKLPEEYSEHKDACTTKSLLMYCALLKHKNKINDIQAFVFAVKNSRVICSVSGPMGGLLEKFFEKMKSLKHDHTHYVLGLNFEFGLNELSLLDNNINHIAGLICPSILNLSPDFLKNKNPDMYVLTSRIISRKFEFGHLVSKDDWEMVPKLRPEKEETFTNLCEKSALNEVLSFCH